MVSRNLMINITSGLHLRPISILCNRAIDFKSAISIEIGNKSVNAKSVLGVLSACVKDGDEIKLVCDGPDEDEALEVLSDMILNGLDHT